MFTGLIQETGSIVSLDRQAGHGSALRLTVSAPTLASQLKVGDSIAVSGVCLTALQPGDGHFQAELAAETITRTSLASLAPGSRVNLELPTPAGAPLGGHIVQGHVDATGTLLALDPVTTAPGTLARNDWRLRIRVPASMAEYVVEKGSIAIEGISLTVASWSQAEGVLEVAVIPHTYEATNLSSLRPGAEINLEADVLIKLAVARQAASFGMDALNPDGFAPTLPYLIANGF